MAKIVEQELVYCTKCAKTTLCMRNGNKINWLMQIIFVILTGGLWIAVILFWLVFKGLSTPIPGTGGKKSEWTCSVCGGNPV